jgi:hypothetical protein
MAGAAQRIDALRPWHALIYGEIIFYFRFNEI